MTTDRNLRGLTRVGLPQKVHTQVGASGPLAVIKRTMIVTTDAMSGMIMHREDRIRPCMGTPPETSAAADVEIVDERGKNQGMASANNAAGSGADTATLVPVGDAATEKDAITRRM